MLPVLIESNIKQTMSTIVERNSFFISYSPLCIVGHETLVPDSGIKSRLTMGCDDGNLKRL